MTNEEKAKELSFWHCKETSCRASECKNCRKAKIDDAVMQMAQWKDNQYKELVRVCKKLISELQTSRNYHLGITGLDTPQEVEMKEIMGNTALIRSIDCTIQYSNEIINTFFEKE